MLVRVRWLGPTGLALLLGASLLNSSTEIGLGGDGHPQTESLSLKSASARAPEPAPSPTPVLRPERVFAVPAVAAQGSVDAPVRFPDGQWALHVDTTVGRKTSSVLTNASSVSDLLGAMNVKLAKTDQVKPGRTATLWSGEHVTVTTVRTRTTTVYVDAPFETLIQNSKDMALGATRVTRAGRNGRVALTYQTVYRNGKEASRRVVKADVVTQPVMEIVVRGTGPAAPQPVPTIAAAAVASPAPPAAPAARSQTGQASWYGCTGNYAAHLTLPKGTRVTVTNLDNGRTVTVVINDRGPYGVPGRIIDLCTTAFSEIAPLAQGVAEVRISW